MAAGHATESVYAHADAITHFRVAIELAHDLGAVHEEVEARESLGNSLRLAGLSVEALEVFRSLSEWQQAHGDDDGRLRALASLSDLARNVGMSEVHTAVERFEEALAVVDRASVAAQARFRIGLARLRWITGHYPAALEEAVHAMDLAERSGDQRIELLGLRALSLAQWANSLDDVATLERTVELATQVGEPEREAGAWIDISISHIAAGRYAESRAADERALDLYRQIGSPGGIQHVHINMGLWDWIAGRWDHLERLLDDTEVELAPSGDAESVASVEGRRAALRIWRGDRSAEARLTECAAADNLIAGLLAEWVIFDGRPQDALDLLEKYGCEVQAQHSGDLLGLRATAHLALGKFEVAEKLVQEGLGAPDRGGLITFRLRFLRVLGMVRSRQGRHDEGETMLRRAAEEAGDLWFLRAQGLHDLGLAYANAEKREPARLALEEAFSLLKRIGAGPFADQVATLLRKLGHNDPETTEPMER